MNTKTLSTIDRYAQLLRLRVSWTQISYDAREGRGYASITWFQDMTPWYWSTENAHGLWSLSVHVPGFQFNVIGPFTLA